MALFGNQTQAQAPVPVVTSYRKTPFDAVGEAQARQAGIYPVPGVYPKLKVDVLKMVESRKGEDLFIAELEIVESQVPDRPEGTRMSWVVNFKHDAAAGNVKAFLSALMDVPPEEIDAQGAAQCCSAQNPCSGRLVRLEASHGTTKKGGPFTICQWRTIPNQ